MRLTYGEFLYVPYQGVRFRDFILSAGYGIFHREVQHPQVKRISAFLPRFLRMAWKGVRSSWHSSRVRMQVMTVCWVRRLRRGYVELAGQAPAQVILAFSTLPFCHDDRRHRIWPSCSVLLATACDGRTRDQRRS